MVEFEMKEIVVKLAILLSAGVFLCSGRYLTYYDLHLEWNPPLYPTYHKVPRTSFSCVGRETGLHADTEAHCQAYHLCHDGSMTSFLCPNATLFHDQFKVCDQFYNVRCGWDLDDL